MEIRSSGAVAKCSDFVIRNVLFGPSRAARAIDKAPAMRVVIELTTPDTRLCLKQGVKQLHTMSQGA